MTRRRRTPPLRFTIEARSLVYAPRSRKVARFDPPRLVAACPMPDCGWYVTAADTPVGAALAAVGRVRHATQAHPDACRIGNLVLPPAPYDGDAAVEAVIVHHPEGAPRP